MLVLTHIFPLEVYGIFFDTQRACNSKVSDPIRQEFELVQDITSVLVTCKFGEDQIKSEGDSLETWVFPL